MTSLFCILFPVNFIFRRRETKRFIASFSKPLQLEFLTSSSSFSRPLPRFQIPESSVLHYNRDPSTNQKLGYPLISVHNVLVFPGVPAMLQKTFYTFDVGEAPALCRPQCSELVACSRYVVRLSNIGVLYDRIAA